LSVKVHSPTEGVIGVKLDHFVHAAPFPVIPLFPDDQPILNSTLNTTESGGSLTSGGLTAEITTNPYTITFKSPTRTLTFAGAKYQAIFDVPSRWTALSASNSSCLALDPSSNPTPAPLPTFVRYINSELNISPGELVYGFGEQFGAFVKNGLCFRHSRRIPNHFVRSSNQGVEPGLVTHICNEIQTLIKFGQTAEHLVNKRTNAYPFTSPTGIMAVFSFPVMAIRGTIEQTPSIHQQPWRSRNRGRKREGQPCRCFNLCEQPRVLYHIR
jgi:hypothetical protein